MAAQLVLTRIDTDKAESLIRVDELICAHLNVEPHPENWIHDWMNTIGFSLALGNDFDKVRSYFTDPDTLAIIDYLEANFRNTSYATR